MDQMEVKNVLIVPHFHYDFVWVKTANRYARIVADNIKKVLELMRKHPKYTFVLDSVLLCEAFHVAYPELWDELKKRVTEGRIEIVCGMYIMPDAHLPNGESIIRQAIYGKKYFQKEFGVDPKVGYMIDVFGHSGQLPQILKKCGYDYYVFWRGINRELPSEFLWEGIDGTRILVHWLSNSYTYFLPPYYELNYMLGVPRYYGNQKIINTLFPIKYLFKRLVVRDRKFSVLGIQFYLLKSQISSLFHRATTDNILILYGTDFSPPFDWIVEVAEYWNQKNPNTLIQFATPEKYFKEVTKNRKKFGVIKGEINGPDDVFPGCYSTRPKVKKHLRVLENSLYAAELLATLASLNGMEYPTSELEEAWTWLLKNDFHDACNGCSIDIVIQNVMKRFLLGEKLANSVINDSLEYLGDRIDTSNEGIPILVFNQLSWERTEPVELTFDFEGTAFEIVDDEGKSYPYQIIHQEAHENFTSYTIVLYAEDLPPVGYKIFFVKSVSKQPVFESPLKISSDANKSMIENEFLTIEFQDNKIHQIKMKNDGFTISSTDAYAINDIRIHKERGDSYYINKSLINHRAFDHQMKIVEQGPVRINVEIRSKLKKKPKSKKSNKIVQNVILNRGTPRIDFRTVISNTLKKVRIQACFPISFPDPKILTEIPYGFIERDVLPSKGKSWAEMQPKFEYYDRIKPVMNWIDFSAANKGISVINFGVPEHELEKDKDYLYLTLIRSVGRVGMFGAGPKAAAIPFSIPLAYEIGKHSFRYALYLHQGNYKLTPRQAWSHNNLPYTKILTNHQGQLSSKHSYLSIEHSNLIVGAIKKGEIDGIIVRLFEINHSSISGKLQWDRPIASASITNMLEQNSKNLKVQDNSIEFPIGQQEIKTLHFKF
ncbi:MAG: hypothetical protein HWN65_01290 [Candidatus Helarchaeota archaeon]|nr:hypothetical protein [Candidatus Helarchaeota archaeon]